VKTRDNRRANQLAGATYMEIMQQGGGIGFTVGQTRASTDDELMSLLLERLNRMLKAGMTCHGLLNEILSCLLVVGTTYVECKTGYGLEWPDELRLLTLLEKARSQVSIGMSITYCAAHAVPK
jgi:imidazolonepropionase